MLTSGLSYLGKQLLKFRPTCSRGFYHDKANHRKASCLSAVQIEGVTPIRVESPTAGVDVAILALAQGQTRLNNGSGGNNQGSSRAAGPMDAVLLYADIDQGRIIGHFDRNTFFNLNGAGTNITRFDYNQFAINLFTAAAGPAQSVLLGDCNLDGLVNFLDIAPFIAILSGNYHATADTNEDGFVNFLDIGPFITLLSL